MRKMPDDAHDSRNWDRQRRMAILARASAGDLDAAYDALDPQPRHSLLRAPETGLVMVQGRAGGTGARFNLGEMTVTRCSVRLADGHVGHAYVAGRSHRHAELAAIFDALACEPARAAAIEKEVLAPLARAQAERRASTGRKAAATKVDFFTMVRGEDAA